MRILRVIASMDPSSGGPCQGIRYTIPELEKLGIENEVVCMDNPDSTYIEEDNFKIHALGPSDNAWAYNKNLLPWLLDNLHNFDAIIVHGLWLYPSYATQKAFSLSIKNMGEKIALPKLFVMPHGMLDPYFQKAPDRKFKAIRNWIYWKLIENKIIKTSNAMLFTCEEELLLARKSFSPYKPQKEINIGYGIAEPAKEADISIKEIRGIPKENYLLYLSRIHQKKGVDLLIKAYAEIIKNKEYKKSKQDFPKLVIAGPGMDSNYGQDLKLLVEEKNLGDSIFFPGMLSGDDKWLAFYNANAFILPSHQENFGIAVVEALACKIPVLISNKVNIWREIEKEAAGFVAEDNLEGTKSLLNMWFDNNIEQRQIMKNNAKTAYLNHFTISGNIKNLQKAIQN